MLHIVEGNMFDDPMDYHVVTVNCLGVAGKGIALEAKRRYPQAMYQYRQKALKGSYDPGHIYTQSTGVWRYNHPGRPVHQDQLILATTKAHWTDNSRMEWVHSILDELATFVQEHDWDPPMTVALPPLGAGLGGLNGASVLRAVRERFEFNHPHYAIYYYLPR